MDDVIKGGLIIGVWLGLSWIALEAIGTPTDNTTACIVPVVTLVAAAWIVNIVDKAVPPRTSGPVCPYPDNWDQLRGAALARDDYRCGNCGSTVGLMVHHIVPLSKGGTNSLSNLRTLCEECHKKLHPHMR